MDTSVLFALGNFLLLIASFPLIYKVLKNRKILKDFDALGATLTFAGLLTFEFCYPFMGYWGSFFLSMPTIFFWGLATIFSLGVVPLDNRGV